MPEAPAPVTFVLGLFGGVDERLGMIDALTGVAGPDDEIILVHGGFFPLEAQIAGRPARMCRLLHVAEAAIPVLYDRATVSATHDRLIFVGPGGLPDRAALDRLRSELLGLGPGAVRIETRPGPGTAAAASAQAVLAASREVLQSIGGMTPHEARARQSDSGLVGTGDLFEVVTQQIRRAGWPVRQVLVEAPRPAPRPGSRSVPAGTGDPGGPPPSRRIPEELRAAMAPTAARDAQWFARWLPDDQRESLLRLSDPDGRGAATAAPSPWTVIRLALFLSWRGQQEYAASILAQSDLSSLTRFEDVVAAVQIMAPFMDFTAVITKLRHAGPQLAQLIAAQAPDQIEIMLRCWAAVDPASPYLADAHGRAALVAPR